MNKDKITTILGVVGAVVMAANPVIGGVSTEVLHSGDWFQVASAGIFALFGYFTNKK